MFNSEVKTSVAVESYPQEAELVIINSEFQKMNAEYSDILYSVEERLHSILNLRVPEKNAEDVPAPKSINDFVGSVRDNLAYYRRQNMRLQKVLEHAKKIIG